MAKADITLAVCVSVCLCGCLKRRQIRLKFSTALEVCPAHCVSHFGADRPCGWTWIKPPLPGCRYKLWLEYLQLRYFGSLFWVNVCRPIRLADASKLCRTSSHFVTSSVKKLHHQQSWCRWDGYYQRRFKNCQNTVATASQLHNRRERERVYNLGNPWYWHVQNASDIPFGVRTRAV